MFSTMSTQSLFPPIYVRLFWIFCCYRQFVVSEQHNTTLLSGNALSLWRHPSYPYVHTSPSCDFTTAGCDLRDPSSVVYFFEFIARNCRTAKCTKRHRQLSKGHRTDSDATLFVRSIWQYLTYSYGIVTSSRSLAYSLYGLQSPAAVYAVRL